MAKPEANLVPWKAFGKNVLAVEIEMEEGINVYPNPSQDVILIEIPAFSKGLSHLKINDLTGKVYLEYEIRGGQKSYSIDIRNLKQGVYFLNAEQGEKRFVKKIVKM